MDQFDYRMRCIDDYLAEAGFASLRFDAVVGRGGLLKPVAGGVYLVSDALAGDLRAGVSGEHAANLGGCWPSAAPGATGCRPMWWIRR